MEVVVFFVFVLIMLMLLSLYLAYKISVSAQVDSGPKSVVKHVGGGYGIVANDRQSAESLLYETLSREGDIGVCQYIHKNSISSLTGICHISENGVKSVTFLN